MFGGGFRRFSRFRGHVLRASPVFCAALLVTVPPRRRRERFQQGASSFIGFGTFFVPKVPIPDLSILKWPLFKSSDDDDDGEEDEGRAFVNGNPQADIVVGLDVGPFSTQAVVVYFPKGSKFPAVGPKPTTKMYEFPNSEMALVTWPRLVWDDETGEGPGRMWDSQGVETGIVLSETPGGDRLVENIGSPKSGPLTEKNADDWKRLIPGFHFLTFVGIDPALEEKYKITVDDAATEFLRGARVHVEEFVEREVVPKALIWGDKPKLKWLVSHHDMYDRLIDEKLEQKKKLWQALKSAGFPIGDGPYSDAGMWDPIMIDGTRQQGDPVHLLKEQQRSACMVELVGRGLMASYFTMATVHPDKRMKEGTVLGVMDDTIFGCMSRIFRVDNAERFNMVDYREISLSQPMGEYSCRSAFLAVLNGKLQQQEGITQEVVDETLINSGTSIWASVEDQLFESACDWADGIETSESIHIVLDDDEGKMPQVSITLEKEDIEFVVGFGLVTPFLMHLDNLFELAENAAGSELQNMVIVNDLINHGDVLGKVFSRIVQMLKDNAQQQPPLGESPSSANPDEDKENEAEVSEYSAMLEMHSAPETHTTYFIKSDGNPVKEFPQIVSQLPNLRRQSFSGFRIHNEKDCNLVFIGMTAACSDELTRMYLRALGWHAMNRAYIPLSR